MPWRAVSTSSSTRGLRGNIRLQISRTAVIIIKAQTAEIDLRQDGSKNPIRHRLKQLHHLHKDFYRSLVPCQREHYAIGQFRKRAPIDERNQRRRVDDDELVMNAQPVDDARNLLGEH